jgi:serine/threonine protein kinase
MATQVGTLIGRYEIDAELGRGAMGVVYRARDLKLDRIVAIKTVSLAGLDSAAEQEYRKRLVVEAKAASRLSHPGIITVFDVREEEPEPYLVMEYVKGQTLQELMSRENRTLPLSTTLRLVQEIAEALHYAHAQGVTHRDIKPANILVDENGHATIADFGIAKLNQTNLTLHGQVLGSPAYMAPEQLEDGDVDSRSDLFSLGVILYYMLTGHRPFQGNSTTTVCFKLVNHEPLPVSSFQGNVSPELDNIVLRAMAKDPAQRYQYGMAMASDIERLREISGFAKPKSDWTTSSLKASLPGGAKSQRGAQSRKPDLSWNLLLASAILAAAIAVGASWSLYRTKQAPSTTTTVQTANPGHSTSTIAAASSELNPEQKTLETPKVPTKLTPATVRKVRVVSTVVPVATVVSSGTVMPVATIVSSGTLRIEIEHDFTEAHASVWVDNSLVYEHLLHGDSKRRGLVFRKVEGYQLDAVNVPSGKHNVRVRIQSSKDSFDETTTMADATIGTNDSILRVVCGKKSGRLELRLE